MRCVLLSFESVLMSALKCGLPVVRPWRAHVARAAVAVILAALGGCASDQGNTKYASVDVRVAHAVPPVEIEADGLPAQTPPPRSIRDMPDDPNEPYSRSYGGVNPSASSAPLQEQRPEPHRPARLPSDLPPDFRRKLVAALDVAD